MTGIFHAAGTAFALVVLAVPALAADKVVTSTRVEAEGDNAGHYVDFAYDCGEECQAASFWCDGSAVLHIDWAEVEAKNLAKVITRKNQSYPLTIGTKVFEMFVHGSTFSEMSGAWEVKSYATFDSRDAYAAIAKAKSIAMELGTDKLMLPVNKDVLDWAAACAK